MRGKNVGTVTTRGNIIHLEAENVPLQWEAAVGTPIQGNESGAQLEGIRTAWIGYWSKVTGGVSTMDR